MVDRALIKKIGIKIGLLIFVTLIILFLIMEYFYLVYDIGFLLYYFLIVFFWIFLAFYKYKQIKKGIDFLSGIALGSFSTIIGVFSFVLFFYFYCSAINHEFLHDLHLRVPEPVTNIATSIVPVVIMIIGIFAGGIFSFVLALFEKNDKI